MENEIVQNANQIKLFGEDLFNTIQSFNMTGEIISIEKPAFPEMQELKMNEMSFFRVDQLLYDDDYPRREAFENVLRSMDEDAFNLVYVLTGKKTGVELCLGVVKNANATEETLSASNYGEMVRKIFDGNFNGSKLTKLRGKNLTDTIIDQAEQYTTAGMIMGIPSMNEETANGDGDFQGIDRLINSMLGAEWRLVVVCEPVKKSVICQIQDQVYGLYDKLAGISKFSLQASKNEGSSHTEGENTSDTRGKNKGINDSTSTSRGTANSMGTRNSNKTESRGTNSGTSESHTAGKNTSDGINQGTSASLSLDITNKKASEIMKYLDEELLERLRTGLAKGLFSTSVYYMAENPAIASRLKSCLMSLFQGDGSTFSPLIHRSLNRDAVKTVNMLKTYQNYAESRVLVDPQVALLHSRPVTAVDNFCYLSTLLTAKEISLYTGLPQIEVPGIVLNNAVTFGLNEEMHSETDLIQLGNMIQKGRVLEAVPFYISQKLLSKHTFIAGVTGSGKTTTCHRILDEVHKTKTPFLIIEPAKTEYRTLINNYRDLVVFTLGNESVAPLRLNPFELIEGEIISSHVDMLKAAFTSAFPMEASMPQILEESIYECYKKKGWNIITNTNRRFGKAAWGTPEAFPILSELLEEMKTVTKGKGFGDRLQAEYIGSLVSRLSNLTVGSKGCMLNCRKSVDFQYLVNHNVILELEDLKSPEDKAFIMGLVLAKTAEVIKREHKHNSSFRHLTLVEEAHRLLTKPDYSDGGARKSAVETFTDLLAEVRKYGEGLVIVDQIPNKLASEVLKNTNTKIIQRILARDDKEVVGDTMEMDDKQKEFLSSLRVGEAIVFTEDTAKPVHVAITRITDTNEDEIADEVVKRRFDKKRGAEFNDAYRDLAVREYMDAFYEILHCISYWDEHEKQRADFLVIVDKIQESTGASKDEIWSDFVTRAMEESGFEHTEKKEALLMFFRQVYPREGFSVDQLDIKDMKYFGGF